VPWTKTDYGFSAGQHAVLPEGKGKGKVHRIFYFLVNKSDNPNYMNDAARLSVVLLETFASWGQEESRQKYYMLKE